MGIVLLKEALSKLKAGKGDAPFIVEGPDGLTLTPYMEDFAEQMKAAERVMKKYRYALRALAK